MDYPRRVHIVPVGFDFDRVVLPLKKMAADRVWLIKEANEKEDKGLSDFQKVVAHLKENLPYCEIKIKTCDLINRDLFDILRVYREIIEEESQNYILINVSTGTKVHSMAGMLVSMIFKGDRDDISAYYAVPEIYEKEEDGSFSVKGCKKVLPIPSYKIERPREDLIAVLKIISELIEDGSKLTKNMLIERLEKNHFLDIHPKTGRSKEDTKSAKYRALDRKYIQPLDDWNFIGIIGDTKRKEIIITEEGRNILKFLG